jgi:predicted alpha/beta superfamily hydrolase
VAALRRLPVLALVLLLAAAAVWAAVQLQRWRDQQEEVRLRDTHTLCGEVEVHDDFRSDLLGAPRRVWVYLPPAYERQVERRYPVLYLQDGQNVFDGATAFVAGREWEVDEAAQRLIDDGRIEPLIVVAIDNGGARRRYEYTPTRDAAAGDGGGLDGYTRMLLTELKPWVDGRYRTRAEREATGIGGSSLGGLAALWIGLHHPEVFSRVGALSVSAWWDDAVVVRAVESLPSRPDVRIWLDVGSREGERTLRDVRRLRDALLGRGWREGRDLHYEESAGATHDESSWAKRMPDVLGFLFLPPAAAGASPALTSSPLPPAAR